MINETHPDDVRALLPAGRQLLYLSQGHNRNNHEQQEYITSRSHGISARHRVDVQIHEVGENTWVYSIPQEVDAQPLLKALFPRLTPTNEEA